MPYVNIRVVGALSREQKQQIAEEVSNTLERIAHKPKAITHVVFEELPGENWAVGGKLLDDK
jgi:4-oxalocrotonate tautomerase